MDYGEIIRRAWNITKKYKYLWVFGFILALFGGGGGYSSNNLSNSFQYTYKRSEIALPVELQQFLFKLQNFAMKNIGLIILFAIFMIILAIAGFILYIIADGGLIGSVKNIEAGEKNSLKDGFKTGSNYFWRMLGKNLLTGLIGVFIALIFLLIFSTIYFLTPISQNKQYLPENVGIILFFIILFFILMIPFMIFLGILNDYSSRFIVIKNNGIIESIKNSFRLIFRNFKHTAIIALVLFTTRIIIGIISFIIFIIIGIPAALICFLLYKSGAIAFMIFVAILAMLFLILISTFINGIRQTFSSSVWTLTFLQLNKPEIHK
ncbi:MAG: hypothetical protein WBA71_04870 [Candidatus Humimicrobiia bacterium]